MTSQSHPTTPSFTDIFKQTDITSNEADCLFRQRDGKEEERILKGVDRAEFQKWLFLRCREYDLQRIQKCLEDENYKLSLMCAIILITEQTIISRFLLFLSQQLDMRSEETCKEEMDYLSEQIDEYVKQRDNLDDRLMCNMIYSGCLANKEDADTIDVMTLLGAYWKEMQNKNDQRLMIYVGEGDRNRVIRTVDEFINNPSVVFKEYYKKRVVKHIDTKAGVKFDEEKRCNLTKHYDMVLVQDSVLCPILLIKNLIKFNSLFVFYCDHPSEIMSTIKYENNKIPTLPFSYMKMKSDIRRDFTVRVFSSVVGMRISNVMSLLSRMSNPVSFKELKSIFDILLLFPLKKMNIANEMQINAINMDGLFDDVISLKKRYNVDGMKVNILEIINSLATEIDLPWCGESNTSRSGLTPIFMPWFIPKTYTKVLFEAAICTMKYHFIKDSPKMKSYYMNVHILPKLRFLYEIERIVGYSQTQKWLDCQSMDDMAYILYSSHVTESNFISELNYGEDSKLEMICHNHFISRGTQYGVFDCKEATDFADTICMFMPSISTENLDAYVAFFVVNNIFRMELDELSLFKINETIMAIRQFRNITTKNVIYDPDELKKMSDGNIDRDALKAGMVKHFTDLLYPNFVPNTPESCTMTSTSCTPSSFVSSDDFNHEDLFSSPLSDSFVTDSEVSTDTFMSDQPSEEYLQLQ